MSQMNCVYGRIIISSHLMIWHDCDAALILFNRGCYCEDAGLDCLTVEHLQY